MKISVAIDCTPEEARSFMGLPDLGPMQAAFLQEFQERVSSQMKAMDPETAIKNWLPASFQNAEQLQKMFWSQIQQTMTQVSEAATTMNPMRDPLKSTKE